MRIEFEIEGLPKTINAIGRKHWAVKAKEAKKWKRLVFLCIRSRGATKSVPRAVLRLTRYSATCPDADGLVTSFKHVLDGIVESGLIPDDTFRTIGMPEYHWEKAPRGKGKIKVVIEMEEMKK